MGLGVVAAGAVWVGSAQFESAQARGSERGSEVATGTVPLTQLPAPAQETYRLIFAGGPFPYPKDGIVFGNREHELPAHPRGFYHEYTVPTPGARTRGAHRIVCGGRPITQPEACYYTSDHYASFRQITP